MTDESNTLMGKVMLKWDGRGGEQCNKAVRFEARVKVDEVQKIADGYIG
jgi:hypothetical protein